MTASIKREGQVWSLCFIDNNTLLAGVSWREMIAVDVQTGKVIKRYEGKYAWPSIATRARPKPVTVSLNVYTYVYIFSFITLKLSLPPIIL